MAGKPNLKIRKKGIEVIFSWKAPERIWEPKTKVWYLSYAALVMFLILLSVIWGYLIMVILLIAFLMLWFIQGTLKPWIAEHKITTQGMYIHKQLYRWDQITVFWFAQKKSHIILYIDFPLKEKSSRLTLLVNSPEDAQKIFDVLVKDIPYGSTKEVQYNFFTRITYGKYMEISDFVPDLDQPTSKQ